MSDHLRQIDEAIAKVRAAPTVEAAYDASSRGNWIGWLYDSSSRRDALVTQLKAVWKRGRLLGAAAPNEIEKFKEFLIMWLQDLRAERAASNACIDPAAPLSDICGELGKLHGRGEWVRLSDVPPAVLDRCWSEGRRVPPDRSAVSILLYMYRGRVERHRRFDDACELVRVLHHLDSGEDERAVGVALVNAFEDRAEPELASRGIARSELRKKPLEIIEECFFAPAAPAEQVLTGGLLMAAYRAILCRSDNGQLYRYSLMLAMRQAYAFFRIGRGEIAEEAVRWAGRKLDELEAALDCTERTLVGKLFLAAAVGARLGNCLDAHLALLLSAQRYLPAEGDDVATCVCMLGDEYQRRGSFKRALELYEEGLRIPGLIDPITLQKLRVGFDSCTSASRSLE